MITLLKFSDARKQQWIYKNSSAATGVNDHHHNQQEHSYKKDSHPYM